MDRRSFLGLVGAAVAGCGGPAWRVVVMAGQNPLFGQRKFAVAPIAFSGLMVGRKPEPVYLAEKDPRQQASFQEDKAGINERFLEHLVARAREAGIEVVPATGPADAPFLVKPSVGFIEPGFYAAVVREASMVRMNVKIVSVDGRLVDEIEVEHGTDPAGGVSIGRIAIPTNPSSGGRLRSDGEALGKLVAAYLSARVGG